VSDQPLYYWIGLGSNMGDRGAALHAAIEQLDAATGLQVVGQSDVWETSPVGELDQPPFLNGVVRVQSSLSPQAVLHTCLGIETSMGRIRSESCRWGPRPIDLDVLMHSTLVVDEAGLQLPHPRMADRAFVLAPLAQLDGGRTHLVSGHTINAMLTVEIEQNGPLEGRCTRIAQ
jgi:2-amino-4-hydroxy-6-hydroxymethyldihydropteridine diphosphokinase